jgi:hypothetical protein
VCVGPSRYVKGIIPDVVFVAKYEMGTGAAKKNQE